MNKCDTCLQTISSSCVKYTGNPILELGLQCDIPLNDALYIYAEYLIKALNDKKIDLTGLNSACVTLNNNEKNSITLLFNKLFSLYCELSNTGVQLASLPLDKVLFTISKLDDYVNGDFWGDMTPMPYDTPIQTKNTAYLFQYILQQIQATYTTQNTFNNLLNDFEDLVANFNTLSDTVDNLNFNVTADWCTGTGTKTLADAIIYIYNTIKVINTSISGNSCTSTFSLSATGYTGITSIKAALEQLIAQTSTNTNYCVGFNVTTDLAIPGPGSDFGTGTFTIIGVSNPATISLIATDSELSATPVIIDLTTAASSSFCQVVTPLTCTGTGSIAGTYNYTVQLNIKSKQASLQFNSGVACKKIMNLNNSGGSGSIS